MYVSYIAFKIISIIITFYTQTNNNCDRICKKGLYAQL